MLDRVARIVVMEVRPARRAYNPVGMLDRVSAIRVRGGGFGVRLFGDSLTFDFQEEVGMG